MKDLEGKTALITGGSSGIGLAIAKKLATHGVRVAIFGTNLERGEKALEQLNEIAPIEHRFYQVDVSKTDQVENAIKDFLHQFSKIDILVNNAGITKDQLLMKMTDQDWDDVLNTNVKSCFLICRALARPLLKAKQGKIINISSVIGLIGNPGQANYAASKGAIIALTKALALEFASRNIQVNCIAPGFIQTKMTDALTEAQKETIISKIPLGRMGQPEDIADAVYFFASDFSKYITGQVLTVDGGMVMY